MSSGRGAAADGDRAASAMAPAGGQRAVVAANGGKDRGRAARDGLR